MKGAFTKKKSSTRLVVCVFSRPAASKLFSFINYNLYFLFLSQAHSYLPGWSTTACTIESPRGSPWSCLIPNLEEKWWAGVDVKTEQQIEVFGQKWPAESSLYQMETGFVSLGLLISVQSEWAHLNCSLTCFQWELVFDNAVRYHCWWFLCTEFQGGRCHCWRTVCLWCR